MNPPKKLSLSWINPNSISGLRGTPNPAKGKKIAHLKTATTPESVLNASALFDQEPEENTVSLTEEEHSKLTSELESLKKELSESHAQTTTAQEAHKRTDDELRVLREENNGLKERIRLTAEQTKSLEQNLEQTRKESETAKETANQAKEQLEKSLTEKENRIKDLQEQSSSKETQISEELSSLIEEKAKEIEKLQEETRWAKENTESTRIKLLNTAEEKEKLHQELQSVKKLSNSLKDSPNKQEQSKKLESELQEKEKEVKSLQQSLTEKDISIKEMEIELKSLKKDAPPATGSASAPASSQTITDLEKKLKDALEEKDDYFHQLNDEHQALEKLTVTYRKLNKEKETLVENQKKLEKTLEESQKELELLKTTAQSQGTPAPKTPQPPSAPSPTAPTAPTPPSSSVFANVATPKPPQNLEPHVAESDKIFHDPHHTHPSTPSHEGGKGESPKPTPTKLQPPPSSPPSPPQQLPKVSPPPLTPSEKEDEPPTKLSTDQNDSILIAEAPRLSTDNLDDSLQAFFGWLKVRAFCSKMFFIDGNNEPYPCSDIPKDEIAITIQLAKSWLKKHTGQSTSESYNIPHQSKFFHLFEVKISWNKASMGFVTELKLDPKSEKVIRSGFITLLQDNHYGK